MRFTVLASIFMATISAQALTADRTVTAVAQVNEGMTIEEATFVANSLAQQACDRFLNARDLKLAKFSPEPAQVIPAPKVSRIIGAKSVPSVRVSALCLGDDTK